MSLTVTQRPNQNGIRVAAKNPVIYKMTRKDYAWTLLVTSSGNTSIRIATDVTANFVTGDIIWLQSDDGAYSASGTVVSSSYGTYTTVVTDVPYVADNASGYINTITKRSNYYVNVGVYNGIGNAFIGQVNYYPTKIGLLTIDISQVLLSILDPSITQILDGVILNETNISNLFYIKYTEIWTGSAESQTNDNAHTMSVIYGAKQIGQDSYYASYFNLLALSNLDTLLLAIGEYYCISWIWQAGTGNWIKKSWYDASNNLLLKTYIKNTNNGGSTNAGVYTLFQKLSLTESVQPDRNITNLGTISWSSNSLLLATGTTSKSWSSPFFLAQNASVSFSYSFTLTGNATNVTPHLYLFDSTGTTLSGSVNIFTGSNGTYTGTGTITNSGSGDAYWIGFDFTNSTGANKTLTMNYLKITIPSTSTRIDFNGIELSSSTTYNESTSVFGTLTGNIISCTKNPITIFWRNSLGGESSWTFNYNQDSVQKLQDPFKNKQLTLYDQNLSLSQFNALNELFSLGQIYQTPLIELTTSVDKTEARIGQQVYIVDSSGNKTGVIVIPSENKTMTKKNRHNFQVTIELPEIFG